MRQHEREFFVSRIRAGVNIIKVNGLTLKVCTPTIEDEYEINDVYMRAFQSARDEEIMTQDEMLDWMIERGLWTEKDFEVEASFKDNVDYLKTELFRSRNDAHRIEEARYHLKTTREFLDGLNQRKFALQDNTCEGIAAMAKSSEFIKRCTYLNGGLYDFDSEGPVAIGEVLNAYYSMVLREPISRELARTEPWRSLWLLNSSNTFTLFHNKDRELSIDQRNLLVWSRMYDNVQESPEAPSDDILEDDDMLDGWFLIQKQKRDKARLEAEMETTGNSKINQSGEIFVMARTKQDRERVESMNSTHSKIIKQQRISAAKQRGMVETGQFTDEKIEMQNMSNEQFMGKFRS